MLLQPRCLLPASQLDGLRRRCVSKKTSSEATPLTEHSTAQSSEPRRSKLPWMTFSGRWACQVCGIMQPRWLSVAAMGEGI